MLSTSSGRLRLLVAPLSASTLLLPGHALALPMFTALLVATLTMLTSLLLLAALMLSALLVPGLLLFVLFHFEPLLTFARASCRCEYGKR